MCSNCPEFIKLNVFNCSPSESTPLCLKPRGAPFHQSPPIKVKQFRTVELMLSPAETVRETIKETSTFCARFLWSRATSCKFSISGAVSPSSFWLTNHALVWRDCLLWNSVCSGGCWFGGEAEVCYCVCGLEPLWSDAAVWGDTKGFRWRRSESCCHTDCIQEFMFCSTSQCPNN